MQNDTYFPSTATEALSRLVLQRVITRFAALASDPPHVGLVPEVHVWIREHDELSVARVRKPVADALDPLMKVKVVIYPEVRAIRDNCGND